MTPVPLALAAGVQLHRALRLTTELLAVTEDHRMASGGVEESAGPNDSSRESASSSADRDNTATDSGEQAGSKFSGDVTLNLGNAKSDQVLDLVALAFHTTALADSLEEVWSDALSLEKLQSANAELNDRFASLASAIQRQIFFHEDSLRRSGVDTKLGRYPTSLEEIKELS
jgi:hypothetical protein